MENEAFASFLFFGTLLVLKMYAVAVITGQVRLRKKAFANPEDALRHGGLQYHREDPDVERCLSVYTLPFSPQSGLQNTANIQCRILIRTDNTNRGNSKRLWILNGMTYVQIGESQKCTIFSF
ncbi:prostaglandin E synthase isoform X2 [Anolis carolinensis]|uniref:prostaglandin E synthase isoform X2 n=1 Tax=Anolis carolinensis TaxID=28377 RepID=UPI002F2B7347